MLITMRSSKKLIIKSIPIPTTKQNKNVTISEYITEAPYIIHPVIDRVEVTLRIHPYLDYT